PLVGGLLFLEQGMNAVLKPEEPRIGVFLDEPAEAYYVKRLDEANNTGLTILDEYSPAHYFDYINTTEDGDTKATSFGRMYHCASLEPDVFASTYAVMPSDAPRDLRYLRNAAKPSDATKQAI